MPFEIQQAITVLERTPPALDGLLEGLPSQWVRARERNDTWSPSEIVSHLILGEKTDWIPRARLILSAAQSPALEPFDMQSHLAYCKGKSIETLLTEFKIIRAGSLEALHGMEIGDDELARTGVHPEFGIVTLRQHLAAWVVHDLNHISQVTRVMAGRYATETGPWKQYMRILRDD